jgi:hypothetical protein
MDIGLATRAEWSAAANFPRMVGGTTLHAGDMPFILAHLFAMNHAHSRRVCYHFRRDNRVDPCLSEFHYRTLVHDSQLESG